VIQIKQRKAESTKKLQGMPSLISRVLCNRGISSSDQIDYKLNRLLPPSGLSHIDQAAELLSEAVIADANIVIVGDFDADGATSCALAIKCLRSFGMNNVSYLVPNRFEYGYGLSPEIVGVAATRHPDIIITVDNGISSIDGVYAAQQLGISVLITDHHLPGEVIPTADVIVNPNLPGDQFASKNLAGVGVIFYVMMATRAALRQQDWFQQNGIAEPKLSQFLDLVALGTVADVVPLDQNNRILVQQGLQRIRQSNACAGILALLSVGNRNPSQIASSDLGFVVGPRLNAAGRLDDMSVGIECLLTDDSDHALALALQLDQLNKQRRQVEESMQLDAMAIVESMQLDPQNPSSIYVLKDATWHQGVVGLVASRIKERTNRPVLVLAPGDSNNEWKGSARSIEGVHIRDMFARVDALNPSLMEKFGGHAMAAGLTISDDKLNEFETLLKQVANETTKDKDWTQILWSDGELTADDFSLDIAENLKLLSPWGQSFPEPLFDGFFEVVEARVVGEKHLKLKLSPKDSNQIIDAIKFSYFDDDQEIPSGQIHIVYRLELNEFQQRTNLQLIVQHISE